MSKLYVNTIYPQSGDLVAVSGNLHISGNLHAYQFETIVHDSTTYRGSNTFGNDSGDVSTFTSQVTASHGAFLASGKKLRIGAAEEAIYGDGTDIHFEVGSGGDINLPASVGLTFGDDGEKIEGDGTDLTIASSNNLTVDAGGDINIDADGSTVYFKDAGTVYARLSSDQGLTVNGALAASGSVTLGDAAADVATVTAQLTASEGLTSTGDAFFNSDVTLGNAAADIITSTGQLTASQGIDVDGRAFFNAAVQIVDDVTLSFGSTNDATIEYDENGTDELRFAGAAVTFEQAVSFDGNMTLGAQAADVITATGQLTASEGLFVASGERLRLGATEETIYGDGTDIHFEVGANGDINIPANIGLTFGHATGDKIEGNASKMTITSQDLLIDSADLIDLDADGGEVNFKDNGVTKGVIKMDTANSFILSSSVSTNDLYLKSGRDIILDADGGDVLITGSLNVSGTINAYKFETIVHNSTTYQGDNTFGNDSGDVSTFTSQITASQGLTSTGRAFFNSGVTLGDAAADVITATGQLTASEGLTSTGDAFFNSDVTLGNAAADIITSTGQLTASQGIDVDGRAFFNAAVQIVDDVTLSFGSANDATIEYDENGTDELRFAGAAVTFEQAVTFDANMTLGNAAADVITCTGQLTASEGMLIPDNERLSLGTGGQTDMYFQNTGATGSLSSSMAFEVYMADDQGLADGTKGAFIFKDSSGEYLSFITRPGAERMAISKEFNAYTDTPITLGNEANVRLKVEETSGANTGSLSASCAFEVNMVDDTGHTDGTKGAFIFKDSSGEYLSFITRPGAERMAISKEFNAYTDTPITLGNEANVKLKVVETSGANTGSLSASCAFEVNMVDDTGHTDSSKAAFTFKDSAGAYLTFNTRAGQEMMVVEKEFNATNDTPITLGDSANVKFKVEESGGKPTGSLSASCAFEINMADDLGSQSGANAAFVFKDSATSYMTFLTRAGQEMMFIEKEFNAHNDTPITFGDQADFKLKSTGTTGSLSSSVAFEIYMADDTGEEDDTNAAFIFKDSAGEYLTFNTRIDNEKVILHKELKHKSATADAPGSGFDGGGITSYVASTNQEIVTTIVIDLSEGSVVSKNTANDIIGENNSNPAYITRITDDVNGIIYKGEMFCQNSPGTGDTDIDLYATSLATASYDDSAHQMQNGHQLVNGGTWTKGKVVDLTIPEGGLTNDYLYLATGAGSTAGTYDEGKLIIKLYGGEAVHGH